MMVEDVQQLADLVAVREIALARASRAERTARGTAAAAARARQAAATLADRLTMRNRTMNAALVARLAHIPERHRAAVLQEIARSARAAEHAGKHLAKAAATLDDCEEEVTIRTQARLRAQTRVDDAKGRHRKAVRRHADRRDEASAEEAFESRRPAS